MTTREQARVLVEHHLASQPGRCVGDSVILDGATMERSWGWVFFYQSREFEESGDEAHFLVGNAPLIVERESGRLFETGTGEPIEVYIHNFEVTGDPYGEPGREIQIYSAHPDADRIAAARVLSRRCDVGVGITKRGIDDVVRGEVFHIAAPTPSTAREICASLAPLGFEARQLPKAVD